MIKQTNKEKVLKVGEIKKSKSSYGNYIFKIEVLRKGLNGNYKTELSIYSIRLTEAQNKRKEYKAKEVLK